MKRGDIKSAGGEKKKSTDVSVRSGKEGYLFLRDRKAESVRKEYRVQLCPFL